MRSKHGTANNLQEFAEFLLDDLEIDGHMVTDKEVVIGRFRDYVANKLGPLTLGDDQQLADAVQLIYKKLLGTDL